MRFRSKEFDFRRPRWGHNLVSIHNKGGGTFTALSISTPIVKQGDVVMWETNYGHVRAKVIESKPYHDPMDMCKITVVVAERVADPAIVSQEEIDNFAF